MFDICCCVLIFNVLLIPDTNPLACVCVCRLLEQAPVQMGEGAERWARLVIPLVVHSASKVRLRAAVALEMGMPLLLAKQQEVAAIIEPMMSNVSFKSCVSLLFSCMCEECSNSCKMACKLLICS